MSGKPPAPSFNYIETDIPPGMTIAEYRAARGDGSILDAIRQPELAAELTLQPVRRYGVDAAILFSDIVVPVAAIDFGVEVSRHSPLALAEAKRVMTQNTRDADAAHVERETVMRYQLTSDDVLEGLRAFAEKRAPNFTGR